MAEPAGEFIDPKEIAEALRKNIESFRPSVEREEVGHVTEPGDGIARGSGLPLAMANELLEFPRGTLGLAFNLDEYEIGCVILGDASHIEEGDPVKLTGKILSVPVGDGFLGRVVQALEDNGAMDYTVVVNAPASDPAPFQYISPYSGAALGAHWMYEGEHSLIIYDDLSKQATAYRTLSLLLRRPPGRE